MRQRRALDNFVHPGDADLDRLALDHSAVRERAELEEHLRGCAGCERRMSDALRFAESLQNLQRASSGPGEKERRKAMRFALGESAAITPCTGPRFDRLEGRVVDVSETGVRVNAPKMIPRGSQVWVQVEKAVVFGLVRHCEQQADSSYDVGVAIDQVVFAPEHRLSAAPPGRIESILDPGDRPSRSSLPVEVLLVEDNPADVTLTKLMLDEIQIAHRLTVVTDGAQAVERLTNASPDRPMLVLLDLNLPKLSGLEVLERTRERRKLAVAMVVVLSVSSAASDRLRSNQLGARAYFQKPLALEGYSDLGLQLGSLMTELVL